MARTGRVDNSFSAMTLPFASGRARTRTLCFFLLVVSCGDATEDGIMDGTYEVVAGDCRMVVDGTPELADLPYEISVVRADGSDIYPEGCIARLTLRTQTCGPSCAPATCEACILADGVLTRAFDDESIQACAALEWRGGVDSDLLFNGAIVDGSVTMDDAGGVGVGLVAVGRASYGFSGERLPAELSCDVSATPAESR